MSRRTLITGADGFIGSHLTELLVKEGYVVRTMALYNARGERGWLDDVPAETLKQCEICSADVRDGGLVMSAMEGCDVVFHLAALIGIPYSYAAPESYLETNVRGTLNVLQAARACGDVKVIQISTSEVYGTPQSVPIAETHALQAQSPYAASKIAADQLALSFHRSFGLPVVVVRPFNTYGPRQSRRAVIPTITAQLLAGRKRVRLGNLSPTRDLLFVGDTVRGMLQADLCDSAIGEVINLGTGFEISMGELANLIVEQIGVDAEIEQEAARQRPAESEVERLCADSEKAARLLNWAPKRRGREGLIDGLRETIDWFRARVPAEVRDSSEYVV